MPVMVCARVWTATCMAAVWLVVYWVPAAHGHPTGAEPHNSMGSCGAFGEAIAEGVWQWCYRNERDNMNGCKASFRSWVGELERTCNARRRELGCSPGDHTAVQWHLHGTEAGQRLRGDRAIRSCEEDRAGQAAEDASPALDREVRERVQRALAAQGFDPGQADGQFGPRTRGAIRSWQQAKGHAATGELTGEQVERLLADSPAGSGAGPGDLYGSIAFSQLDGGGYAFGIAWNAQGREAARRSAVEECGRRGGGRGCSEAGWFRNACGAIAIGDANGYGTGWGENTGEAESSALSKCQSANRNCRVAMSRCVDGQYNEHETAILKPLGPNWLIAKDQPCQVYNRYSRPGETVTWSGACMDGKATGNGKAVWQSADGDSTYDGKFRAGKPDGFGIQRWAAGTHYKGQWRAGRLHGYGTFKYPGGASYNGEFRDDKPHGNGTLTTPDGQRFVGPWRKGCFGKRNGRKANFLQSAAECGFK